MSEPDTENWQAVTDAIRERMRELEMSTAHLARESGLSESTVRYLGKSLSGHNKAALVALSGVLRWRYDHLTNILHNEPEKNVHIRVPTPTVFERVVHEEATSLRQQINSVAETVNAIKRELHRGATMDSQRLAQLDNPEDTRSATLTLRFPWSKRNHAPCQPSRWFALRPRGPLSAVGHGLSVPAGMVPP